MTSDRQRMGCGYACLAVFLLFGFSLLQLGVEQFLRARESVRWPRSCGKVVESTMETDEGPGSSGATYSARVVYQFTVDGRGVRGQRIAYGDYDSDDDHARGILRR